VRVCVCVRVDLEGPVFAGRSTVACLQCVCVCVVCGCVRVGVFERECV